jgi:pyruvate,orthophosphate dikinase
VVKPGLYEMQVRALVEAAVQQAQNGKKPVVEIMIPLTISREEMELARGWVESAIAAATSGVKLKKKLEIMIGTMIEVPRAALRAEDMAEFAEFFSFGTNDLTQMALGFSRDDIEGRIMAYYVENGLLKTNPFETIDFDGVGELVKVAVERGKAARPDIKLGVCGEHGGDPSSIYFFYECGLDYVSCSPFRVPIARLSAAQAVLGAGTGSDTR